MLNMVQLIGHLGADPETAVLGSGDRVANLRLATSETWKDKATGERKESTEWHRIRIYNPHLVKVVEEYTRKGSRVYVSGALRTRKYTDNNGVERYSTEIVLGQFNGEVRLLDRPPAREQHGQDAYGTTTTREGGERRPAPTGGGAGGRGGYELDDDIPF